MHGHTSVSCTRWKLTPSKIQPIPVGHGHVRGCMCCSDSPMIHSVLISWLAASVAVQSLSGHTDQEIGKAAVGLQE